MSTPGHEFREAEYLGLGYLAVSTSELLDRVLSGQRLDADDMDTLERARQFLSDVSSGARLVTAGTPSNVSPVESVRKFSYSVEPLGQMQENLRAADFGDAIDRMASSVGAVLEPGAHFNVADVTMTKDFFHQLHIFLVNMIEARKRKTGAEFSIGQASLENA
jgi:hypothetical protein